MTSVPLIALMLAASSTCADDSTVEIAPIAADDLVALAATEFVFDPAAEPGPATTSPADSKPKEFFGAAHTARWNVLGSIASDLNDALVPQASLGLSYFIADYLSLDVTGDVQYCVQEGSNAFGGGFTLLFRWHIWHGECWTFYVDGGAGMLFSTEDIPAGASRINFTPQGGAGATFDLGNDTRLMTGVRVYHTSNANTASDNDGRNLAMFYMGLSFPF